MIGNAEKENSSMNKNGSWEESMLMLAATLFGPNPCIVNESPYCCPHLTLKRMRIKTHGGNGVNGISEI